MAEMQPTIHMEIKMPSVVIRIKGHLDEHWTEWFDEFEIKHTDTAETLLTGKVHDQSALYGVLARLRDLGLTLVEVKITEGEQRLNAL